MAKEDITQDSKGKATKILLIEDSPSDARLFQEALKERPQMKGYKVITAQTGEEGIKLARQERPDMVIIDTLLPGIDGFQVCQKIKKIKKLATKVIIYTGVVDAVDAVKAREFGADDYTAKTSDLSPLIETVKKLI